MKRLSTLILVALLGAMALIAIFGNPWRHEQVAEPPVAEAPAMPPPAAPVPVVEEPAAGIAEEPPSEPEVLVDPVSQPAAQATSSPDPTGSGSCEEELAKLGVVFEPLATIAEGKCGAERPLKVSNVGLPLTPAITTRCEVARALATWTKNVMIPSAQFYLGSKPTGLMTGDSYMCRDRRGETTEKVSEHALANAADVMGVKFDGREPVMIMARTDGTDGTAAFQAAIRGGACAYFTTVLGPGSNAAHADHLHFDMIERASGYRICQ